MRFPVPKHQNQTKQICISPAPGRSSKLKHTGVEIDTRAFQTGCQLSSAASGMSLELCFLHNFSGMKRTCWTTGSWRSCLSMEVVSSIPAGSTIIYRFLCGFICVSLCQNIKIKPNKYILNQNEFTDHVYCISQHFPELGASVEILIVLWISQVLNVWCNVLHVFYQGKAYLIYLVIKHANIRCASSQLNPLR